MPFSSRRPNLFIVGAMKAGTTSLWVKLRSHPQIFMCWPKEPCFFADPAQLNYNRVSWTRACAGDTRRYLALFAKAPAAARVLGEASVIYTQLPTYTGIPERMVRFNPAARILYIVRDPVVRAVSHYFQRVKGGYERLEPAEALFRDPNYVGYSRYDMQLAPYWSRFGPEQVRVVTLESFSAAPQAVLRDLFAWLGVDPEFSVPTPDKRYLVTGERVHREIGPRALHRLRRSRPARLAARLLPAALRNGLRSLVTREVQRETAMTPAILGPLREALLEPTEAFSALVGRRFESEWTTLYARQA